MSNRHLIAVFVAVFLLTVCLGSWRNGSRSLPGMRPRAAEPVPSAALEAGAPGWSDGARAPVDLASIAHPRNAPMTDDMLVISDEAPYPVDDAGPPSMLDPTQSEVPVLLAVDTSTGTARHRATIRNLGSDFLSLKITAVNPPNGNRSVVQVAVAPRAELNLTDAGLIVATGAEISVESPPFLAQTTTVY
ncbi:MAG TPA: hypothetical protein VMT83_11360 [Burkholderiaceae bacterium]|nr:hypothetical protein [Burkholderiaceae bacterium]